MKKLIITAAALMTAAAAYGQGTFLFNTHDTGVTPPNNVKFVDGSGNGVTGSDWFVQVLAGPDAAHLTPLTGASGANLALNRTGSLAGYANPLLDSFTVPGSPGGSTVTVGYQAYEGSSFASATTKGPLTTASVVLSAPPATPTEVSLGTQTITVTVPEPATLALGLLGAGALLLIRRRS